MAPSLNPVPTITVTPGDRRHRRGDRRRRPAPPARRRDRRSCVRDALHEHSVLFFHDQDLSEDEQLAFASTFGPVGQYPLTKMFGGTAMSSTIEDTADSPPDADGWHTDVTWVAEPPAYAVLNAKVIPERGGDTMWASLFAAYDALVARDAGPVLPTDGAPPLRRRLPRARVAQHGRRGRRADHDRVPAGRAPARAHPSRHRTTRAVPLGPVHGPDRRACTATRATRCSGILSRHIENPNFCVRWHWTEGDVAVWDEASTNHRALSDHYPAHRVMRRCTVEGGRPSFQAGD